MLQLVVGDCGKGGEVILARKVLSENIKVLEGVGGCSTNIDKFEAICSSCSWCRVKLTTCTAV